MNRILILNSIAAIATDLGCSILRLNFSSMPDSLIQRIDLSRDILKVRFVTPSVAVFAGDDNVFVHHIQENDHHEIDTIEIQGTVAEILTEIDMNEFALLFTDGKIKRYQFALEKSDFRNGVIELE